MTDKYLSTSYEFKIQVFNEAPYFLESLSDLFVQVGKEIVYRFPKAEDAEFLPIKLKVTLSGGKALPSFIKHQGNKLVVRPTENK